MQAPETADTLSLRRAGQIGQGIDNLPSSCDKIQRDHEQRPNLASIDFKPGLKKKAFNLKQYIHHLSRLPEELAEKHPPR